VLASWIKELTIGQESPFFLSKGLIMMAFVTGFRIGARFAVCPGILLVSLISLSGCSKQNTPLPPQIITLPGLQISADTTPSPPHTGDDVLHITLTDPKTNSPIGNANLTANVEMLAPRLPGAPVSGRAQGNGHYDIPIQLAVATQYSVKLHIEQTGMPPVDVEIPLEAQ
jgi:hypothetical protein